MEQDAKAEMRTAGASSKTKKVRGIVFVNDARCKGCGFCIAFCPPHVLAFSEAFNIHGYHPPHLAQPAGCTGCDLCGLYCPDFAIYSVMIKDDPLPCEKADDSAEEAEP